MVDPLSGLDEALWNELENSYQRTQDQDMEMLITLETGAEYHTAEQSPDGIEAIKRHTIQTEVGLALDPDRVSGGAGLEAGYQEVQGQGGPVRGSPPTDPTVKALAGVVPDPPRSASSSASETVCPPAPEIKLKSKQARAIAAEIEELKQAKAKKEVTGEPATEPPASQP